MKTLSVGKSMDDLSYVRVIDFSSNEMSRSVELYLFSIFSCLNEKKKSELMEVVWFLFFFNFFVPGGAGQGLDKRESCWLVDEVCVFCEA